MSGNGEYIPSNGAITLLLGNYAPVVLPAGSGGGCRDISAAVNMDYANATAIVNLLGQNNIADFQLTMQGIPGSGNIGVHGGGHYTIGGDPADDVFSSPGDPVFYLHHGMIDLTWWVWQMLDFKHRRNQISGTQSLLNQPLSANVTLDDTVDLYYTGGGPITMRELMSVNEGPFCYNYSL
ncbi:Di-copper centre-containing protein [Achaetomium macrosporum]|uniref:Di-copper centre-containing protein n=1 Tax=Achaetomium macrosporum TaxID=79813 RepID=A0AAN7C1C2_9PEZI|nr:Di-copper centre-containing protein [Achaetomium macrosporum]